MIDAVISPHSPRSCGTAKWSLRLAEKLGVPFVQASWTRAPFYRHPLISTRLSEWPHDWQVDNPYQAYDLFVHDIWGGFHDLINGATRVYAANREIADWLRAVRADEAIVQAWCPSSVAGRHDLDGWRVLTFGMAHKIQRSHFEWLARELAETHPDYTILWTCAIHEGRLWEDDMARAEGVLRDIFGDRLRVLGSLADDGLALALRHCDAVAVFFEDGVRENNTTVWAALDSGHEVYTNRDTQSPDLTDRARYSWDALLQTMGAHVAV